MNSAVRPRRWAALIAAGAAVAALTVGTAGPALAVTPSAATPAPAATGLPPLDPAKLQRAIGDIPNADVTSALIRVQGSAGHWYGTAGTEELGDSRKIPADARFRIGSISKVFTATVVLQLAAEHRIELDRPVQDYLPGVLPADFPPIQVGQLLNHTSGLPGGGDLMGNDGTNEWFVAHRDESATPGQVVASLAGQQMQFQPGTAQQYNGMNTFVVGLLIEQVTGHSYAHEVRNRITRPLGLHETSVPDADDTGLPGPHTHGYLTVKDADGSTEQVDVSEQSPWPWAEGGMISSATDLDRFMAALFQGRLLPAAEQQELFTVPDVPNHHSSQCNFGPTAGHACMSMGIERVTLPNGVEIWGKTGSRPGYTSGVFATRDGSRRVVYSLNPTGLDGRESRYLLPIGLAAFDPAAIK